MIVVVIKVKRISATKGVGSSMPYVSALATSF